MRAISPSFEYQRGFLAMLDDFDRHDSDNGVYFAAARQDFAAYLRSLLVAEQGLDLPDGCVPCSHLWLVDDEEQVVGVARLRHRIDMPFWSKHGGHIGYHVARSQRRRGYGHLALAAALGEAKRRDINRVVLFVAADNAASRATVERAGGVLEQVAYSSFWLKKFCRYSIDVPR